MAKWFGLFRDTMDDNNPRFDPGQRVIGTEYPWYDMKGVTVSNPRDWMGTWVIDVQWENGKTESVAIDSLSERF